ncbi:hypothetical protein D3870_08135 [Noviherbaspirillum cavernae]|uniref:Uncharacterized protein n=1 Tax=Noviherbaspirillum cavernae TaxID=2320862 RepID=A0A418X0H0_9BURK|nr:hypothetical protein [Noviherbaspirillum cavernae]RJG05988.1 hypothetical protein D3870_08135 [Noviherbaspirillum cavernae]
MQNEIDSVFWLPPGDAVITRLGIVEVTPGEILTPNDHEEKLGYRMQILVDNAKMSLRSLDSLFYKKLTERGIDVAYRALECAGVDLVADLASRLRAAGALISEPVQIPMESRPGVQAWHDETTLVAWIQRASMWLR